MNQLWKIVGLITVWNLKHLLKMQNETEIGKSYGSICHIVKMPRQTLAKYF